MFNLSRKVLSLSLSLTSKTKTLCIPYKQIPAAHAAWKFPKTIEKYALFRHLIDSNGIVDEAVLDKLKLNVRSLIASQEEDSKDLLDLCIDVIYHNNMKAFGLQQLIKLYLTWLNSQEAEEEES